MPRTSNAIDKRDAARQGEDLKHANERIDGLLAKQANYTANLAEMETRVEDADAENEGSKEYAKRCLEARNDLAVKEEETHRRALRYAGELDQARAELTKARAELTKAHADLASMRGTEIVLDGRIGDLLVQVESQEQEIDDHERRNRAQAEMLDLTQHLAKEQREKLIRFSADRARAGMGAGAEAEAEASQPSQPSQPSQASQASHPSQPNAARKRTADTVDLTGDDKHESEPVLKRAKRGAAEKSEELTARLQEFERNSRVGHSDSESTWDDDCD